MHRNDPLPETSAAESAHPLLLLFQSTIAVSRSTDAPSSELSLILPAKLSQALGPRLRMKIETGSDWPVKEIMCSLRIGFTLAHISGTDAR